MRNKEDSRRYIRRGLCLSLCLLFALTALVSCQSGGGETSADTITADTTTVPDTTRAVITVPDTLPGIDTDSDTVTEKTGHVTTMPPPRTTPEVTEPPADPVRLSFVGMGDNIVYRSTYNQSLKDDGTYDFKPKYKRVESFIKQADIAFINQETPMCGAKYGYHTYPQFNTPNEMGYDLISLGFDIISFANNHMADMGYESSTCVSEMIDFTDTLDAFIIGLYRDFDDFENIRVYEKDGVKIAFLAYTYGTNLYHQQTETTKIKGAYFPIYDEDTITRQVKKANGLADLVFVSIHWGTEDSHKVNAEQQNLAQLMADLGVDVILGHHPHVIQRIEWLTGIDGNKTLCYYSLGNGLNAQDYLRNMVGITASFDIVKDEAGARIENASCIPTFNVMTPLYKNISIIPLNELTDEICEKHHCNSKDQKVTVKKAYDIVKNNIDAEFLPDYLK